MADQPVRALPRDRSGDHPHMGHIYFTSDPHFGEARNAERRGFSSPEAHDEHLIGVMRERLRENDTLYIAGDLGQHRHALELVRSLPGKKHLVAGNHDVVHPMHRTANGSNLRLHLEVFDTVQPFRRRQVDGIEYAISHFPYSSWGDGPERETSRHHEWRLPESDYPLVHGHTHGTERAHGVMFHVGWDAWGDLVPEETIIRWVKQLTAL